MKSQKIVQEFTLISMYAVVGKIDKLKITKILLYLKFKYNLSAFKVKKNHYPI